MKGTKINVYGIQGSGKTWCVANYLIPSFQNPIIYGVHPSDYIQAKGIILNPKNLSTDELDRNCELIKEKAIKGECDCFVLDEADMFLGNSIESIKKYPHLYDLIINHRHYKKGYPFIDDKNLSGLAVIFITRRPQSIPTEVTESSEYYFVYAIAGENVKRKLINIHSGFRELLPFLKKDEHNFIFYRVGDNPKLYSSIRLVTKEEAKEGENENGKNTKQ